MIKKLVVAPLAVAAALSLSACSMMGESGWPASSPAAAPADLSDPGHENSTPSVYERSTGPLDTAFPAGSRNSSPD